MGDRSNRHPLPHSGCTIENWSEKEWKNPNSRTRAIQYVCALLSISRCFASFISPFENSAVPFRLVAVENCAFGVITLCRTLLRGGVGVGDSSLSEVARLVRVCPWKSSTLSLSISSDTLEWMKNHALVLYASSVSNPYLRFRVSVSSSAFRELGHCQTCIKTT